MTLKQRLQLSVDYTKLEAITGVLLEMKPIDAVVADRLSEARTAMIEAMRYMRELAKEK